MDFHRIECILEASMNDMLKHSIGPAHSGRTRLPRRFHQAVLLGLLCSIALQAADPSAEGIDFFENKIRPLLAEHCYSCHSHTSEKLKGGLHLDSREAMLRGGDTGPAIKPGDPDASLLIRAVRYTDEGLRMPPKDKRLKPDQILALETWVRMGAPAPQSAAPLTTPGEQRIRSHWAFQPVRRIDPPRVRNTRWIETSVDSFILAKLEEHGLTPSPAADKRALLRRATYGLTGLPPTPEEVRDFLSDPSPRAFERVVERLLQSPHYGERWGRHWLDVARYADTKGYVFEEERRYPYAYTYRDYVVRAFNEDLPYDRFLIEQMAADQLDLGEDKRPLAAMGFLTLGRRFLNNIHDIIDDRIDVVMRGTQGLTVACARCHDHKYDPISIKEYYGLYGVFAGSQEPADKPLLGSASLPGDFKAYEKERARRNEELETFKQAKEDETLAEVRRRTGDYLLAAFDTKAFADLSKVDSLARERKLDPGITKRWRETLQQWEKEAPVHPIFGVWIEASRSAGTNREALVAAAIQPRLEGLTNVFARSVLATNTPRTLASLAECYGTLFRLVEDAWKTALQSDPRSSGLADPAREEVRRLLHADSSPARVARSELRRLFDVPSAQKLRRLQRQLDELDATHPGAPPRAMVLNDSASPGNARVFIRGNPNNPGPEAPRASIGILSGGQSRPFQRGSGRLEMAQAIASRDNPLTARVMVNRVWLHHFGSPLVETPGDFGLRSEPPSHPELLDYLAWRFMEEGWSVKMLHRWILLSSAYRQSSEDRPEARAKDPSNRLLWKSNRKRLDLEAMRDGLLAVSGKLNRSAGGHSVEILSEPFSGRRSVYGFIERQNLPGFFRSFDFASPDTTTSKRFSTTVPQQALYLLNSPFVVEQARLAAGNFQPDRVSNERVRLQALYQRVLQRDADEAELRSAEIFLQNAATRPDPDPPKPLWQFGFGGSTNGSASTFQLLPVHSEKAWRASASLPDKQHGWLQLTAKGGHPGPSQEMAAIRRWTAPDAGVVSVVGTLRRPSESGDGVRGRIVSSRRGVLGSWNVEKGEVRTELSRVEVEAREALDFAVDCLGTDAYDSFEWTLKIKAVRTVGGAPVLEGEWDSESGFSARKQEAPPRLSAWERYAQALLLSNEFFFLD